MIFKQILFLGFLVFSSVAVSTATLAHEIVAPKRTLTLVGSGSMKSKPDMAIVRLGVVRQAKTARKAIHISNLAMEKIFKQISGAGIDKKDIQTSNFSVRPLYTRMTRSKLLPNHPPEISRYRVSNEVIVTIRDLQAVGAIIDEVVAAGSNKVNSIQFSLQNPKPARDTASRDAVGDALNKAKLYALAAGIQLGPIISIREQGGAGMFRPVMQRSMASRSARVKAVPVAGGQLTTTMQVHIVWEIK